MTNSQDDRLRQALLRLGDGGAREPGDVPLPPLFRTPVIGLLWIMLVMIIVGLIALGRVRVPRLAPGVAVAVESGTDSVSLMLLLPPDVATYVRAGQHATLDVGDDRPVVLDLAAVEPAPLDAGAARQRFPRSPHVLAHLEAPKVAVALSRCGADRTCLTPEAGAAYRAVVALGTRTLASYAWSSTPALSR